jgi:hypothetical protein
MSTIASYLNELSNSSSSFSINSTKLESGLQPSLRPIVQFLLTKILISKLYDYLMA